MQHRRIVPLVNTVTDGRVAVLASGGLDSCVLLHELAKRYPAVFPVYIKSGLFWETVELSWLKKFLRAVNHPAIRPVAVMDMPTKDLYGKHWSVTGRDTPGYHAAVDSNYLPGRNLLLLAKTAVYCALNDIATVALALLEGNPFPDSRPAFLGALARAVSEGLRLDLRIITPFLGCSKADVIRKGRALPLELSFSCLSPVGRIHCGRCTKCAERQAAFGQAGVPDKTRYAT